jgi:malic enzyme
MFLAAANALADEVTAEERKRDFLFPAVWRLREVTARVAAAIVRAAREEGVGLSLDDGAIPRALAAAMWDPSYPTFDPTLPRPTATEVADGAQAVPLQ